MIYEYREDINSSISPAGNKLRKLAYVLPDALQNPRLKRWITIGGVQSNCCRQTASVAARLGLECTLVLTQDVDGHHRRTASYNATGNVQLARLLGADVRIIETSSVQNEHDGGVVNDQRSYIGAGVRPEELDNTYFLSQGASANPGAGVGYAKWVFEMLQQEFVLRGNVMLVGSGVSDTIVVASTTGGTLAGMVAGMRFTESTGWIDRELPRHIIGAETFAKDPQR